MASHGGERAAIITDLGSWTDELVAHVRGCEHISIEGPITITTKLMYGPYPYSLKDRISGRGGHLSNEQTGTVLGRGVHGNDPEHHPYAPEREKQRPAPRRINRAVLHRRGVLGRPANIGSKRTGFFALHRRHSMRTVHGGKQHDQLTPFRLVEVNG